METVTRRTNESRTEAKRRDLGARKRDAEATDGAEPTTRAESRNEGRATMPRASHSRADQEREGTEADVKTFRRYILGCTAIGDDTRRPATITSQTCDVSHVAVPPCSADVAGQPITSS